MDVGDASKKLAAIRREFADSQESYRSDEIARSNERAASLRAVDELWAQLDGFGQRRLEADVTTTRRFLHGELAFDEARRAIRLAEQEKREPKSVVEPHRNPWQWFVYVLQENYGEFEGRATRAEYWSFALFYFALVVVPSLVGRFRLGGDGLAVVAIIWALVAAVALFVPTLGVTVRRLHDAGKSGWWWFITFIPYLGGAILLLMVLAESEDAANQWGPKTVVAGRFDDAPSLTTS